jgi:hypothetical protein
MTPKKAGMPATTRLGCIQEQQEQQRDQQQQSQQTRTPTEQGHFTEARQIELLYSFRERRCNKEDDSNRKDDRSCQYVSSGNIFK